jgi:hypothetical protein
MHFAEVSETSCAPVDGIGIATVSRVEKFDWVCIYFSIE